MPLCALIGQLVAYDPGLRAGSAAAVDQAPIRIATMNRSPSLSRPAAGGDLHI
jgi:hypothetical protein